MTCSACHHEHTGLNLGGICIGCPCEHVVYYDLDDFDRGQAFCAADEAQEPWPCPIVLGTIEPAAPI